MSEIGVICRSQLDRLQQISLLSASETLFRHCLSIAESFVQNWSRFPVDLEYRNIEEIHTLLDSREDETPCEELNAFSFDELKNDYDQLCCIDRIVIEVLKSVGGWDDD